ncbi:MAG: LysM peptidoglycan-binding domain-containing protein [Hymenobacter sp.]|nr:MAG: LysM peptidoglycan-binding domain-containing protein [Hymenobacter sp.]
MQAGQRLRLRADGAAADRTRVFSQATGHQPARLNTHTVQPGDTLFNISRRFGVSMQELRRLNHLKSDDVKLGQKLLVQAG